MFSASRAFWWVAQSMNRVTSESLAYSYTTKRIRQRWTSKHQALGDECVTRFHAQRIISLCGSAVARLVEGESEKK
jgi:hypothetical protein